MLRIFNGATKTLNAATKTLNRSWTANISTTTVAGESKKKLSSSEGTYLFKNNSNMK